MAHFLGQAGTFVEILEAADRASEQHFAQSVLWYRGHANIEWGLVPTAHRLHPVLEKQMALHFKYRAPGFCSECPPQDDFAAWLPLMRHSGLPTRLLDWSESLAAAVFFACVLDERPGPSRIWMLNPGRLNEIHGAGLIPPIHAPQVRPLLDAIYDGELIDVALAVFAPRTNLRLHAQLGNFTIHGGRDRLESTTDSNSFLAYVDVAESALPSIRRALDTLGVKRSTLLPDLPNLAAEIAALVAITNNDN